MPDPMPSATIGRTRRPPYEPPRYRPRRSRFLLVGLPLFAVFAAFGSIVWLAYVDGAPSSAMGEPPLIRADATPLKLSPDDPGGRVVADQGEVRELFRDEPAPQPELLLPRPEEPITALAQAELEPELPNAAPDGRDAGGPEVGLAAPSQTGQGQGAGAGQTAPTGTLAEPDPTATPARPEPAEATAQANSTATSASRDQAAASGAPADGSAAVEDPEAALDALLAEVTASRGEASEGATTAPRAEPAPGAQQAQPSPPAAEPAPGAQQAQPSTPAAEPAPPPRQPAQDVRPAIAVPVPQRSEPSGTLPARAEREGADIAAIAPGEPVREPPPVQNAPNQVAPTGSYRIQLAAVREESDARRAWDLFQLDLGDVLVDSDPIIERADTANGVFYRVQVGPFANLASAESLCDRLKQRNASCFVIRR